MNHFINGMTIRYRDAIKTADYVDPRTVELTANTAPPEGTDVEAHVAEVLAMLKRRTHAALHGTELPGSTAPAASPQPEAAPATGKGKGGRKAQIEADEAAAKAAGASQTGSDGGAQTSGDAAGFEDPAPAETPAPATSAAGLGDEWDTAPAADVTDQALVEAVTKKNGELQAAGMSAEAAPVEIRKLIATYNPDPSKAFAIREIGQDKRADFLAKLAAIKAA